MTQTTNILTIDLEAIGHNVDLIHSSHQMIAVLKADAYGTDPHRMATYLYSKSVQLIAVAHLHEALELIEGNVPQEILLFGAFQEEFPSIVAHDIQYCVSSQREIENIAEEASRQNKEVKLHLHIDTGMTRLGCLPHEAAALAESIQSHPHLILEGLMTHLTSSDLAEHDLYTNRQIEAFEAVVKQFPEVPYVHVSNSSGLLRFPHLPYNTVRIGIALYGIKAKPPFIPALSLTTRILHINDCLDGQTVSYHKTYSPKQKAPIGILPIGYAHGLNRALSNRGSVIVHGKKAPIVGSITMNNTMIDLSGIPEAKIGDSVTIFGRKQPLETLAAAGNLIPYELLTGLSRSILREFQYGPSKWVTQTALLASHELHS